MERKDARYKSSTFSKEEARSMLDDAPPMTVGQKGTPINSTGILVRYSPESNLISQERSSDLVMNGGQRAVIRRTAEHQFQHSSENKGNLCKRSSSLERCLMVTVLIMVLVVVVLSVKLSLDTGSHNVNEVQVSAADNNTAVRYEIRPCHTPACLAATAVLASMNTSVDPCTDFYQYACGGWIQANPLPAGYPKLNAMDKLQIQNYDILKSILEDASFENWSEAEKKARSYYHSCLDKSRVAEELGPKPMLDLINKVGGWNISGDFNIRTWNFQKTVELLQVYNPEGPFSLTPVAHIIWMHTQYLGLKADYYINKTADDKILGAYLEYMTQVGVLLGGDRTSTREQMKDIIEFETKLANMDFNLAFISAFELSSLDPLINLPQYLRSVFERVHIKISSSQKLLFNLNIFPLVMKYWASAKGRIVLSNYLTWSLVHSMVPYMSEPFRRARLILLKSLRGVKEEKRRWLHCIADTDGAIGFALGAMFVEKTFRDESKSDLKQMFLKVQRAFASNILNLNWLDELTSLKVRLKTMTTGIEPIGFPSYIFNPWQLNQEYEALDFSPHEYFKNKLSVRKFQLLQKLRNKETPDDPTKWVNTPATVTANYDPEWNNIRVMAGLLRPPFYDLSQPKWMNFGGVGMIMAHELTHGYDKQEKIFDKENSPHQWWENATVRIFEAKRQCFVDQYSEFTVNGEKLKGEEYLRDNIADNGGLKAAFNAYQGWLLDNTEPSLPLTNLTNNQLFFVAFAQNWCRSVTKEEEQFLSVTDIHSPDKYRVIGTLSNSLDFAEEFRCPTGSAMNPKLKCDLF